MRIALFVSMFGFLSLLSDRAHAQIDRNPTGVNVAVDRPTSLLIRYSELNGNAFFSSEALFCTQLLANGACAPGTILGRLPARLDRGSVPLAGNGAPITPPIQPLKISPNLSSSSSAQSASNSLTDFMTIPMSVIRSAVERSRTGAFSDFFYVRQFTPVAGADIGAGPGQNVFVSVTCRLTGGTARTPLSLSRVELFGEEKDSIKSDEDRGVRFIRLTPANFDEGNVKARISYTGVGRLVGWWEVREPGAPEIKPVDLFTEASLPFSERSRQQRFTRVKRVDQQLFSSGEILLEGPRYSDLPTTQTGLYEILLRLDVSEDRETRSSLSITGEPINLFAGALANFPLQPIEYFVPPGLEDHTSRYVLNPRLGTEGLQSKLRWNKPSAGDLVIEVLLSREIEGSEPKTLIAPASRGEVSLPQSWTESPPTELKVRILDQAGNTFLKSESVILE